jgi:lipid-A-disaccharide synthase
MFWVWLLMKAKWISLINLLAGDTVVPEMMPTRPDGAAAAGPIVTWLTDDAARAAVQDRLRALRDRVAVPGACGRAAQFILDLVKQARPQAA